MFEEKDPLLTSPNENATPAELKALVTLLQARVVEITRKLKSKNGEVRAQRKDVRRKDVALAKKKHVAVEQSEKCPKKSFLQYLKFWEMKRR